MSLRIGLPLLVIPLLFSGISLGQPTAEVVASIRDRYKSVSEKVRLCEQDDDHATGGELFVNELVVNSRDHQWRAVGIYKQTVRFFFRGGDTERSMYPDELVFIKTERRSSVRVYREEFLFSPAGDLLFFFRAAENDDDEPRETRVYFSRSRPIRIIDDSTTRDNLSVRDREKAKAVLADATNLRSVFIRSLKL